MFQILAKRTLVTDYKVIYFSVVLIQPSLLMSQKLEIKSSKLFPTILYYYVLGSSIVSLAFYLKNYFFFLRRSCTLGNIGKVKQLVENLERVVDPIKKELSTRAEMHVQLGDCRSTTLKTLFMETHNNLLCGLREIFITNTNISVKIIISKYDHYLHRVLGCAW